MVLTRILWFTAESFDPEIPNDESNLLIKLYSNNVTSYKNRHTQPSWIWRVSWLYAIGIVIQLLCETGVTLNYRHLEAYWLRMVITLYVGWGRKFVSVIQFPPVKVRKAFRTRVSTHWISTQTSLADHKSSSFFTSGFQFPQDSSLFLPDLFFKLSIPLYSCPCAWYTTRCVIIFVCSSLILKERF